VNRVLNEDMSRGNAKDKIAKKLLEIFGVRVEEGNLKMLADIVSELPM